jgi:hypothetical protein
VARGMRINLVAGVGRGLERVAAVGVEYLGELEESDFQRRAPLQEGDDESVQLFGRADHVEGGGGGRKESGGLVDGLDDAVRWVAAGHRLDDGLLSVECCVDELSVTGKPLNTCCPGPSDGQESDGSGAAWLK